MFVPDAPKQNKVKGESLLALHKIWSELALFPVWDVTSALKHFLREMCSILNANDSAWIVMRKESRLPKDISIDHYSTIFDEMDGWSPMTAEYLNPERVYKKVVERWLMHARREGLDPISSQLLEGAGKYTRALIRDDVATDQEWENHWISKKYHNFYGIGERIFACTPITETCEICITIDRPIGFGPFTVEDRDFMKFAVGSVPSLHKRLCFERGLLGSSALLSNREMDTYRLLLTDQSESEIADLLKLSNHTIHDYAKQLYRKFDVKGRIGLMAKVLAS